jgi:hypothetical protein
MSRKSLFSPSQKLTFSIWGWFNTGEPGKVDGKKGVKITRVQSPELDARKAEWAPVLPKNNDFMPWIRWGGAVSMERYYGKYHHPDNAALPG